MAKCPVQTFTGIEAAQFDCLKEKATAAGITIDGDSGSATKAGVTITWEYNRTEKELQLQCTDAPFWISCGVVSSQITSLVENCTSGVGGTGNPSQPSL